MKKTNVKQNKGITLIALIITIIVLVILAGVTLNLTLGQNGIFKTAQDASKKYDYSVALEKLNIKIMEFKTKIIIEEQRNATIKELAEYLGDSEETEIILKEYNKIASNISIPSEVKNIVVQVVGYEEYQFLIEEQCTVTKVSFDGGVSFSKIDKSDNTTTQSLASQVQIGDYVAYNALAYDEEGKAYTYTSPAGTGAEHGNGYKEQTHTTKSDIKWRVLSKDTSSGEVVLISEKSLVRDETGYPFYMKGAIAYLYAEEELNRICSIYGHGYGANTSKVFTCETGDPVEGLEQVTLTGSGSRSLTADDLNAITGFDKTNDKTYASDYGKSITHTVGHATKTTLDGVSIQEVTRTDINTNYSCYPTDYLEKTNVMYKMLFDELEDGTNPFGFWLASRAIGGGDGSLYYTIGSVEEEYNKPRIYMYGNMFGYSDQDDDKFSYSGVQNRVRPIVYLKNTLQTSGKDSNGAWTIIDQ